MIDNHMLEIPYVENPGKACALASNTMVAKYFFPEISFDDIAKISGWEKGYVVWQFKFWYWIMEKGIKVKDYDLINYQAWAERGEQGLKDSLSEKEFKFYKKNTRNLDIVAKDINKVLGHENFIYIRQKPQFADLLSAYKSGAVCEAVLDSKTLDGEDGFSLHRVVILDIDEENIIFHDPRKKPRPARKESIDLFGKAWLEKVSEPELCIYKK